MSLYDKKDIELLTNNIDIINETIEKRQLELYEPTKKEKQEVTDIILDFIKQNKRKIYGGYAINKLVGDKEPKDMFYKDYQTPDVDFYSPNPIEDLINICNTLHAKNYKRVNAREAGHKDTYSIFVNFQLYCDISYVPKNIYNRMPFKEINGFNYIHPHFITIDYLRMIVDPLASYWRIEKSIKRFSLLQKHYPLPLIDKPIKIIDSTPDIDKAVNLITKFLLNKKSCISIGFLAYNYFINESKITNKNIKSLNIPYHEIISINYKEDFEDLMKVLKEEMPSSKFSYKEYYPFFQFTGYSVEIYLESDVIAVLYTDNKKCLPYIRVPAKENKSDELIIGSFTLTLLYAQIMVMKYRTNNDEIMKSVYMTIVSHLMSARKYYFQKNNKTILDNTLYRDFIVDCMGYTIDPDRERMLLYESRRNKGKKSYYMYVPEQRNDKDKEDKEDKKDKENKEKEESKDTAYIFGNYSGNLIKNQKNSQLIEKPKKDIDEEIIEPELDEDENKEI